MSLVDKVNLSGSYDNSLLPRVSFRLSFFVSAFSHKSPSGLYSACVTNACLRHLTILVPRAYDPSGLQQESRALGATISGMRHR